MWRINFIIIVLMGFIYNSNFNYNKIDVDEIYCSVLNQLSSELGDSIFVNSKSFIPKRMNRVDRTLDTLIGEEIAKDLILNHIKENDTKKEIELAQECEISSKVYLSVQENSVSFEVNNTGVQFSTPYISGEYGMLYIDIFQGKENSEGLLLVLKLKDNNWEIIYKKRVWFS